MASQDSCTISELGEMVDALIESKRKLREELDDLLLYLGISKMEYLRYKVTGSLKLGSLAEKDRQILNLQANVSDLRVENEKLLSEKAELESTVSELEVGDKAIQDLYDKINAEIEE